MIRTYRYPLRPTKAQAATLESWLGSCQRLYNAALEQRRDAWRRQLRSVGYYAQQTDLTALRADGEYADVPVWVARSALRRLDRAFKAFFQRVKTGEEPGYPRFRSRTRYDSFDLGSNAVRIDGNRVHVPKLGPVKFHRYRDFDGDVRHVEIKRTARGWVVCIVCDVGEAPAREPVQTAVGIDLGLTTFAALDDGTLIANPRYFREGEEVLARRQRSLSRKKRGSNSRRRARTLVARAHEHVRNQRTDFSRKLACKLFQQYDLIAHEDLNIRGLARGPLAKSVADASWGRFIQILTCKAESAGKWVVPVNPRGTSQRCSECGATVMKTLYERVHRCGCGYVADRDVNAARNVLALGRSAVGKAEGVV